MTEEKREDKKPRLAVVIPVYNEEECIEQVLSDWYQTLNSYGSSFETEFIIIDDGSQDSTPQKLDQLAKNWNRFQVIHKTNAGHGQAIRQGYQEAILKDVDYVFQTDSDDQFTPQNFIDLWEKRLESPFVIGIRSQRQDPLHRKLISSFLALIIRDFFDIRIQDANIPYRLFRADYLKELLAAIPHNVFAPNIFLSILAAAHLKKVPEIPVIHKSRETGQVSLVSLGLIKVCLRSFRELFQFKYNLYEKVQFLKNKPQ